MKTNIFLYTILFSIFFISCTDDNDDSQYDLNKEIEGLIKIQEITNETHTIEVYSVDGIISQGYNNITLRITDKVTNNFVTNASLEWKPVMHMTDKMHSCPNSDIEKVEGKQTIYMGYIVFQMASMGNEGWTLTLNYNIDGVNYVAEDEIYVMPSDKRVVSVFMGEDGTKYVLALKDPLNPEVKVNDISAGLYKMEDMMNFSIVENYLIELDPRMPSMGNHSSPNNEDLTYDVHEEMYSGKLSLTMTGYWKLNLRLLNENHELVKGELVTDDNESSSLFFELEF